MADSPQLSYAKNQVTIAAAQLEQAQGNLSLVQGQVGFTPSAIGQRQLDKAQQEVTTAEGNLASAQKALNAINDPAVSAATPQEATTQQAAIEAKDAPAQNTPTAPPVTATINPVSATPATIVETKATGTSGRNAGTADDQAVPEGTQVPTAASVITAPTSSDAATTLATAQVSANKVAALSNTDLVTAKSTAASADAAYQTTYAAVTQADIAAGQAGLNATASAANAQALTAQAALLQTQAVTARATADNSELLAAQAENNAQNQDHALAVVQQNVAVAQTNADTASLKAAASNRPNDIAAAQQAQSDLQAAQALVPPAQAAATQAEKDRDAANAKADADDATADHIEATAANTTLDSNIAVAQAAQDQATAVQLKTAATDAGNTNSAALINSQTADAAQASAQTQADNAKLLVADPTNVVAANAIATSADAAAASAAQASQDAREKFIVAQDAQSAAEDAQLEASNAHVDAENDLVNANEALRQAQLSGDSQAINDASANVQAVQAQVDSTQATLDTANQNLATANGSADAAQAGVTAANATETAADATAAAAHDAASASAAAKSAADSAAKVKAAEAAKATAAAEAAYQATQVHRNPAYQYFFTETYQQLPKLRLAPDLLVYINKSRTFKTWTGDTFDLNDWLVTANGGTGTDRTGNCTLSFYIPRHLETYFIGLAGRFIIRPFYECEIYAKGRFLVDGAADAFSSEAENFGRTLDTNDPDFPTSRYYRIFWGFVSSIQAEWQDGDYQIIINCAHALRLFELTHLRSNLTALNPANKTSDVNPFANPGFQGDPISVILTTYCQDVDVTTELNATPSATTSTRDQALFRTPGDANTAPTEFEKLANRSLMAWRQRLVELQKRTTFFGLGFRDPITGKTNEETMDFERNEHIQQQLKAAQVPSNQSAIDLRQQRLDRLNATIKTDTTTMEALQASIENDVSLKNSLNQDTEQYGTVLERLNVNEAKANTLQATINSNQDKADALKNEIASLAPVASASTGAKTTGSKAPVIADQPSPSAGPLNLYDIISKISSGTKNNSPSADTQAVPNKAVVSGKTPDKTNLKTTADVKFSIYLQDWAITNYTPYFSLGQFKLFNIDENKKRLEILSEMADAIGYEFFQDLNGNVIFKPPFYNMDTRSDAIFTINDIDIISEQLIEDESRVAVTNMVVQGTREIVIDNSTPTEITVTSQWHDLRLLSKYGQRQKTIKMAMVRSPQAAFVYAVACMSRENRYLHQMNIQIPARPELMLGFPVYLQGRDCFGYVERIQWNYSAGSDFVFNLSLSTIRRRVYINKKRLEDIKKYRKLRTVSPADSKPSGGTTSTPQAPTATAAQASAKPDASEAKTKIFPITSGAYTISSAFRAKDPSHNNPSHPYGHTGVDLACSENSTIYAPVDGTVTSSGSSGGATLAITLKSSVDASKHNFFHCISSCASGPVKAGQAIGYSGGGPIWKLKYNPPPASSTGPHVHWQVSYADQGAVPNGLKPNTFKAIAGWMVDPQAWFSGLALDASSTPTGSPTQVLEQDRFNTKLAADDPHPVTSRADLEGNGIFDLVPVPNGVLQVYLPDTTDPSKAGYKAKDAGVVSESGTKLTVNPAKVAADKQDAALAASNTAQANLATAQATYDTQKTALTKQLKYWTDQKAAYTAELGTFGKTPYDFYADNMNWHIIGVQGDKQDALDEATETWNSINGLFSPTAKKAAKADVDAAKKELDDVTKEMHTQADAAITAAMHNVPDPTDKTATYDIDAKIKDIQTQLAALETPLADAKKAAGSTQTALGNSKNTSSSTQEMIGQAGSYADNYTNGKNKITEIDDILDTDPDSQIFAFGQDTFKNPLTHFQNDASLAKKEAAIQDKMNAASFFRPNVFSPYRLVIDDRFMGPIQPAVPAKIQGGNIASEVAALDAPTQTMAGQAGDTAAAADSALADAQAKAAQIGGGIARYKGIITGNTNLLADIANGQNGHEGMTALSTTIVPAFKQAISSSDEGPTVYSAAELEAMIPKQQFLACYYGNVPDARSAAYTYQAIGTPTDPDGIDKQYSYLVAMLAGGMAYYQALLDDYTAQSTKAKAAIAQANEDLANAQAELNDTNNQIARLQGVSTSANKRANSFKSSGNAAVTDINGNPLATITIDEYMALLLYQQPYTDINGFEQMAGFAWGRSVNVASAAEQLRLDAGGLKFTDMSPQVMSNKAKSYQTSASIEAPSKPAGAAGPAGEKVSAPPVTTAPATPAAAPDQAHVAYIDSLTGGIPPGPGSSVGGGENTAAQGASRVEQQRAKNASHPPKVIVPTEAGQSGDQGNGTDY